MKKIVKYIILTVLCFFLVLPIMAGGKKELAPSEGPVTLKMWSWRFTDPGFMEHFGNLKTEFEGNHPNVTIELQEEPIKGYQNKLITYFTAGDPPDIVHSPSDVGTQLIEQGWLAPLDKYMVNSDIKENWCKMQEGLVKNGKTFGILLEGYGVGLIYNKKLLDEAGLGVPGSFDEFMNTAKKISRDLDGDGLKDIYGYGVSSISENAFYWGLLDLVMAYGGFFVQPSGEITANSEAVIKGVKAFKELHDNGAIAKATARTEMRRMFAEEKIAMILDGPWRFDQAIAQNPDIKPNLEVIVPPFETVRGGPSNFLALPENGEHNDLAWEFMKLWTTQKTMEQYAKLIGTPARKNSIPLKVLEEKPYMKIFGETLAKSTDKKMKGALDAKENKARDIIVDYTQRVIFNNEPVKETMDQLQKELEKLAAENG